MATYDVWITIDASMTVEADTPDDAIKLAKGRFYSGEEPEIMAVTFDGADEAYGEGTGTTDCPAREQQPEGEVA